MNLSFNSFFIIIIFAILGSFLWFFRAKHRRFLERVTKIKVVPDGVSYDCFAMELTYNGFIIEFFSGVILGSIMVILAFYQSNVYTGIGIAIAFIYPWLVLFLRRKTFHESSINPWTEKGYDPINFYMWSFISCIFTFILGFSMLNFNIPYYIPFIMIFMGFFSSSIILIPDKINKFLSYDIRSKKGYDFLLRLTILIIITNALVYFILVIPYNI